jgi:hypothetical protein
MYYEDEDDYDAEEIRNSPILEKYIPNEVSPADVQSHNIKVAAEDLPEDLPKTEMESKPPLNRRSRRRLAREIEAVNYSVVTSEGTKPDKPLIELKKIMARPAGCTFLGAKSVRTWATVNGLDGDALAIMIDSGSDITLISEKHLEQLTNSLKIKAGQSINLIQVTGNTSIKAYVTLDLYFYTQDGPVKINVDAYVVKGMSAPFILGNDFQDQYGISVMRREGETYVVFGDTGRQIRVASSTSSTMVDESGHAFKVLSGKVSTKASIHRKHQKLKKRARARISNNEVRARSRIVIQPETSVAVPVEIYFPDGID